MLDIDITLIYQIAGYFVLLVVLNQILYKPLLKLLKERDDRTAGFLKEAADTDKEVSEGMVAYEKRIKEATLKGLEEKNRIIAGAVKEEKELLEKAGAEVAEEIGLMRGRLLDEKDRVLSRLKQETAAISRDIAEKLLDKRVASFLLAFLLPLLPALAYAASGGHAEHAEHAGPPLGEFWRLVVFLLLAAGFVIVWMKMGRKAMDERAAGIEKAIAEAKAAKEAADRKAAEYREKLSALEARINEVVSQIRTGGEAEKTRILKETETAVEKIKEQAKSAAGHELKKARQEIQAEVAELAVKMAEEILRRELAPADHERLVKAYVDKLRFN